MRQVRGSLGNSCSFPVLTRFNTTPVKLNISFVNLQRLLCLIRHYIRRISHCQAMMKFLTQHDYIMKRLLALFTLLLPFIAGVVSMQAQTPDATAISSSEVPDGYYFIARDRKSVV